MTYPPDWPVCPNCGKPALDGHITCGSYACGEHKFRRQRADEHLAMRFKAVAPPNTGGGPVTFHNVPVRHPDGRPVMAGDLVPGADYEVTEDGMLIAGPRVDWDVDWYALSNGISTVMPDGTLVDPQATENSDDDDGR